MHVYHLDNTGSETLAVTELEKKMSAFWCLYVITEFAKLPSSLELHLEVLSA